MINLLKQIFTRKRNIIIDTLTEIRDENICNTCSVPLKNHPITSTPHIFVVNHENYEVNTLLENLQKAKKWKK